jgi:signal peptidase I
VKPGVRPFVLCTAVASLFAVVATAYWSKQWNLITITLLIAVLWAATISVVDAYASWRRSEPLPVESDGRGSVTIVMRLGEERLDIARTSLALAASAGPVVVVATRHHDLLDDLGSLDIREFVAPSIAEALREAARAITSDAVLVISASAFPLADACAHAAAQLTDGVGWVVGSAPSFNNDRYAPGEREALAASARGAARDLGLITWEPDATLVRTALLREHPLQSGRPDGGWLRDRSDDGWRGAVRSEPIAVRAAPADAPVFWPTQTKRRRGAVADLADAATRGPVPARLAATGGLLRELYAFPIVLWLLAIVAIGRSGSFPMSVGAVTFFGLHAGLAGARWVASRLEYGVGLHPVDEAREAAYDAPGSLLALPSAMTRRVHAVRFEIPDQPLLWIALVVTLLTTIPLLDRRPTADDTVGVAVGLALAALAATWVFALRAFGARGWDRASYRLAVEFPATLEGAPVRTVDASPSGIAVVGGPTAPKRGASVVVTVRFSETRTATVRGRVTDIRGIGDQTEVGVALELGAEERIAWVRDLFAPAAVAGDALPLSFAATKHSRPGFSHDQPSFSRRIVTALQVVLVSGISILVLGSLLLAFLGYRPMVVRSGSMVPTLGIGDVVINDWVRVDQVRPGEIVTFPAHIVRPELVTHRVQRVRVSGDTAYVVTKGDANTVPESWSLPRDTLVGHVDGRIPKIGRLLVVLGQSSTRWFLLAVSMAVVLVAVGVGATRRRRTIRVAMSV